jgi:hypothetical protein
MPQKVLALVNGKKTEVYVQTGDIPPGHIFRGSVVAKANSSFTVYQNTSVSVLSEVGTLNVQINGSFKALSSSQVVAEANSSILVKAV